MWWNDAVSNLSADEVSDLIFKLKIAQWILGIYLVAAGSVFLCGVARSIPWIYSFIFPYGKGRS